MQLAPVTMTTGTLTAMASLKGKTKGTWLRSKQAGHTHSLLAAHEHYRPANTEIRQSYESLGPSGGIALKKQHTQVGQSGTPKRAALSGRSIQHDDLHRS